MQSTFEQELSEAIVIAAMQLARRQIAREFGAPTKRVGELGIECRGIKLAIDCSAVKSSNDILFQFKATAAAQGVFPV